MSASDSRDAIATAVKVFRHGGLDAKCLPVAIATVAQIDGLPESLVRERWEEKERYIRFSVAHGVLKPDHDASVENG